MSRRSTPAVPDRLGAVAHSGAAAVAANAQRAAKVAGGALSDVAGDRFGHSVDALATRGRRARKKAKKEAERRRKAAMKQVHRNRKQAKQLRKQAKDLKKEAGRRFQQSGLQDAAAQVLERPAAKPKHRKRRLLMLALLAGAAVAASKAKRPRT